MNQPNDGGQLALAGFLYQILGSASLAAEVFDGTPCHDGDIDTTFAIVNLESRGQDAEIVSTNDTQRARTLVQFKYSGNPSRYPVGPQDLVDILEGFRRSKVAADASDALATDFLLMTNRNLSDGAKSIVQAGESDQPDKLLDAIEETVNGEEKYKGRTKRKTKQYQSIVKRLQIEVVNDDAYRTGLAARARDFGILQSEMPMAVNRLIGVFFQRAASPGNRAITASELDEALIGFTNPRRLTDSAVSERILEDVARQKKRFMLPDKMLHREELFRHPALTSRALVIIHGAGGAGKTVAACQIIEAALTEARPPFGAITSVESLSSSWISEVVSRWRNSQQPDHHAEQTDTAIQRLRTASAGPPPILLLALDGIDEAGPIPEYRAIGHILRFFADEDSRCQVEHRPPKAILLVTCRNPQDVYSQWINRGGFPSRVDSANCLSLREVFTDRELCQIADQVLDSSVASRIRHTTAAAADCPDVREVAGDLARVAVPDVIEALKHPGLWRLFSELHANEQHKALDGDPQYLGGLCHSFVDWLCTKAQLRRHSIPADTTRVIVNAVATAFGDPPERTGDKKRDWDRPAEEATHSRLDASRVFEEAVSLGLVLKLDPLHWKWRHPFMCEHLANLQI
jgi:hypothetical protein